MFRYISDHLRLISRDFEWVTPALRTILHDFRNFYDAVVLDERLRYSRAKMTVLAEGVHALFDDALA
jgi:hypothetical protein